MHLIKTLTNIWRQQPVKTQPPQPTLIQEEVYNDGNWYDEWDNDDEWDDDDDDDD